VEAEGTALCVSQGVQKLAVRMMQKLGFMPDVAINGGEAITMHRTHPYDVILMV
jgi:hypothetical protein